MPPPSPPARSQLLHYGVRAPAPFNNIRPSTDLVQFNAAILNPANSASGTGLNVVTWGDSNTLITGQNNLAPGENLFGMLIRHLRACNRGTTFTGTSGASSGGNVWDRAIGGTGVATMTANAVSLGYAQPTWYTSTSQNWPVYIAQRKPDLVIINSGINDGPNTAQAAIKAVLQALGNSTDYPIVPSIIFVINPSTARTFNTGTNYWLEGLQATAAYMRSIAKTGAAAALGSADTALQRLPQIGYIDLGRYDAMCRLGFDPCHQPLTASMTGVTGITGSAWVGGTTYTFPECDGDFLVNLSFPNVTSSTFFSGRFMTFNVGPSMATQSAPSTFVLSNNGGLVGSTYRVGNGANSIVGSNTGSFGPQAMTVRLLVQQERMRAEVNGAVVFDQAVARPSAKFQPQLIFSADASAVSMDVTLYAPGKRVQYAPVITDIEAWGDPAGDLSNGNGKNHWNSAGIQSIVAPIVMAANLSARG
jgi:lysophospholipase L1-like esterase